MAEIKHKTTQSHFTLEERVLNLEQRLDKLILKVIGIRDKLPDKELLKRVEDAKKLIEARKKVCSCADSVKGRFVENINMHRCANCCGKILPK